MSNALKYIKSLEAAGFQRNQAEAQVQMVLDAIEGDLVTKQDFAIFKEHIDNRIVQSEARLTHVIIQLQHDFTNQMSQIKQDMNTRFLEIDNRFNESELRMTLRLGAITVGTMTIGIALLTWLIKV